MLKDAESPTPSPYSLPSLVALVQEMNPDTSSIKNFPKHRKTAVMFRDSHLKLFLQSAFRFFKFTIHAPSSSTEMALSVIISCLSFDFLGTLSDQDNHGMTSAVQIPASLKSWIIEENPMEQLFEGLKTYQSQHVQLIEALGLIMGCRRSLFMEEERVVQFNKCCGLISTMLAMPFGEDARSELLKLLMRFSIVYQSDMKKNEGAVTLLDSFLRFTQQAIPTTNSTDYLFIVQIWMQLRESEHVFFVERIEQIHQVVVSFVNLPPDMLEMLYFEDENTVEQVVVPLGRFFRQLSIAFAAQVLVARIQRHGNVYTGLGYIETAWTLSIYTSIMSNRVAYQAESSDDVSDGGTCSQIFNYLAQKPVLVNGQDKCEEQLELSILAFFEQFKHTFLTGDGSGCPKMWETVATQSQVKTQEHVVILCLNRALHYLKDQSTEALVFKSVSVFKELVNGTRSLKLLQTQEIMGYIEGSGVLTFHMKTSYQKSKCLTILFENIGRLFVSDLHGNVPEPNLFKLLQPITEYFNEYESRLNDGSQMDLIVRKLRGILSSVYSSKLYKVFFEWIRPHLASLTYFLNSPAAINGPVNILKFIRDLSSNKVNRLVFENAAEYGILLFREVVSIVLPIVGSLKSALSQTLAETIWVSQALKPIVVLMDTFKNLISSRVVPFGIMQLYGDVALNEMIQAIYLLSSFIEPEQLMQYSKLGAVCFSYLF